MAKNKVNEALLIDDEVDKVYASKREEKLQKKIAKIEAKYNKKIQKIENQNKKEKKNRIISMKNALVTGLCGVILLGSAAFVQNFDSIKNFFNRDNNNPGVTEKEENTGRDDQDNKDGQEENKDKDEGDITAEFEVNGNTYRVYSGKGGVTTKITPTNESSKPAQSKTTSGSTSNSVGVPEGSISQEEHDKKTSQEIQERVENGETSIDLNKGVTVVVDERTETEVSNTTPTPTTPSNTTTEQPKTEEKLNLEGKKVVKSDGNEIRTEVQSSGADFQTMDEMDFEDFADFER